MIKRKISIHIIFCCLIVISMICMFSDSKSIKEIEEIEEVIEEYIMPDEIDKYAFIISIMHTESRFDNKVINHSTNAIGVLQIRKIFVDEVNRILKLQKSDKRYSYDDRYSIENSVEMFIIMQEFHNPEFDKQKCLHLHYGKRCKYYTAKVYKTYNSIKNEFNLVKQYEINYEKSVLLSYIKII